MKRLFLIAPLLWMTAASAALSQAPKPDKEAPPEPPLMVSVPPNMQWTVTYAQRTPEKEPVTPEEIRARKLRVRYNPNILAKRGVKVGAQTVIFTNYEAGLKSETWLSGGYLYATPTYEGEGVHIEQKSGNDFSEIFWVKAENFRGTVDLKGRKAHLYETAAADPSAPPPTPVPHQKLPDGTYTDEINQVPKPPPQRVYIDAESRLPLIVDTGVTTLTYQYAAAPPSLPVPDVRIQKFMQEAGAKAARANP